MMWRRIAPRPEKPLLVIMQLLGHTVPEKMASLGKN
jgi:hypothetical protein